MDEFIPISFRNHFYASTGRTRKYPLQAFLWALFFQRIFSIPTDRLLLTFLAYKFVYPKMIWAYDKSAQKAHRQCCCENPCTTSTCGRMVYIYPEKDLRAYPGTVRGTKEWDDIYKIRTVVERDINHIKDNLCLAGRRTQNEKTLHADLSLAGITQLITVVLADKIHHHEYIRSVKPLIA